MERRHGICWKPGGSRTPPCRQDLCEMTDLPSNAADAAFSACRSSCSPSTWRRPGRRRRSSSGRSACTTWTATASSTSTKWPRLCRCVCCAALRSIDCEVALCLTVCCLPGHLRHAGRVLVQPARGLGRGARQEHLRQDGREQRPAVDARGVPQGVLAGRGAVQDAGAVEPLALRQPPRALQSAVGAAGVAAPRPTPRPTRRPAPRVAPQLGATRTRWCVAAACRDAAHCSANGATCVYTLVCLRVCGWMCACVCAYLCEWTSARVTRMYVQRETFHLRKCQILPPRASVWALPFPSPLADFTVFF